VPFLFHAKWARDRSLNHANTFDRDRIFFTPVGRAAILVYIENRPYAGYDSEREALEAVELWQRFWPPAKTATFRILRKF
jgi:hypothetical protein